MRYVELITTNVSTLKTTKLTQAQYDRELAAGNIDDNALYLTPDETDDIAAAVGEVLADAPDITVKDGGIIKIENADGTQYMSMSEMGFVILDNSQVMSVTSDTIQFVGSTTGKVTGLAAPTGDNHAANKAYVDTKQDKITGTAGQFVVIGDDGTPTTVSLTNVSEVGA